MKHYRVGIIGFGAIGSVHAWAYAGLPFCYAPLPFSARVHAVATAHRDTAEAAAQICGAETAVTDYRQITENPDIDIVHVCTPNVDHARQLFSALTHHKAVYSDKPLTATWSEALELAPLLATHRNRVGMAFQLRFFPALMRARALMDDGRIGRVLSFRIVYLHAGSADPAVPAKWKLTHAAGGGVIADLASHVLDLLASLGGEPVRISAESSVAFPHRPAVDDPSRMVEIDAEDHVVALVHARFGNDPPALGTIEATKIATGTEDELRLEIHGTEGAIRFNSMEPHHLGFYRVDAPAAPLGGERGWTSIDVGGRFPAPAAAFPGPKFVVGWPRMHLAAIAGFLFALHEGRMPVPGAVEALYAQHLVDVLQRSAAGSADVQPWSRDLVTALLEPPETRRNQPRETP